AGSTRGTVHFGRRASQAAASWAAVSGTRLPDSSIRRPLSSSAHARSSSTGRGSGETSHADTASPDLTRTRRPSAHQAATAVPGGKGRGGVTGRPVSASQTWADHRPTRRTRRPSGLNEADEYASGAWTGGVTASPVPASQTRIRKPAGERTAE